MLKEKKPTLKDEVIEDAYKKCQRERGKDDPMCTGLYAQAKAEMLTTDAYLDKVDDHIKRGQRRPKKTSSGGDNDEGDIHG